MPLRLGDDEIAVLYLGETRLDRLYLGADLLWSAASVPSAPTATPALHGSTGISLRWTLPASGGADITGYDVEYRRSGAQSWTDAGHTGLSRVDVITGLTRGATYEFRVRATNSEGAGAWSPTVTATPAGAPSAPNAPTLLRRALTSLTVTWTTPAANGAAITDYDVRYREQGAMNWTDYPFAGTGTSTPIPGLDVATTYEIQVRAHNAAGASAWSPSLTAMTPRWVSRTFQGVTGYWIRVSWDDALSGPAHQIAVHLDDSQSHAILQIGAATVGVAGALAMNKNESGDVARTLQTDRGLSDVLPIGALTSSQAVFLAGDAPFDRWNVDLEFGVNGGAAETTTVEYWHVDDGWTAVSGLTDGTVVEGDTRDFPFRRDGALGWTLP